METPNAERDVVRRVGICRKMLDQARSMMQLDAQVSPSNPSVTCKCLRPQTKVRDPYTRVTVTSLPGAAFRASINAFHEFNG
jgi:hypothetical protein